MGSTAFKSARSMAQVTMLSLLAYAVVLIIDFLVTQSVATQLQTVIAEDRGLSATDLALLFDRPRLVAILVIASFLISIVSFFHLAATRIW